MTVLDGIWSPQLDNQRDIYVYLPPSYSEGQQHYPVIYMHDAQNLFDEATSFSGEWQVDETMEALSEHEERTMAAHSRMVRKLHTGPGSELTTRGIWTDSLFVPSHVP